MSLWNMEEIVQQNKFSQKSILIYKM